MRFRDSGTGTSAPTARGSAGEINAALDRLQRDREYALAWLSGRDLSVRMAALYEVEARCWSALFECATTRVYWRAAVAAEMGARRLARHWRRRAEMEAASVPLSARFGGCVEIEQWTQDWQAQLAGGAP